MAAPQPFAWEKSPVICNEVIDSGPVPLLVITRFCAGLAMPTACEEKLKEAADKLTAGLVELPLSAMVTAAGFPPKLTVSVPV
jgi:hypothetical protein